METRFERTRGWSGWNLGWGENVHFKSGKPFFAAVAVVVGVILLFMEGTRGISTNRERLTLRKKVMTFGGRHRDMLMCSYTFVRTHNNDFKMRTSPNFLLIYNSSGWH